MVAGAGAVGCFVGGLLAAAGRRVTLLGRPAVLTPIHAQGALRLTDYTGLDLVVAADNLALSDDPACLGAADLVLVTVKSGATAGIASEIARHAPAHAPVVSLQNGVDNRATLADALPGRDVRAGMVPFNVIPKAPAHFHRATSGDIRIGAGPGGLSAWLSAPHLKVGQTPDIDAVQWGKLLVNLANALNALSGLTLHEQLLNRDWRRLMADQMAEALTVLRAQGLRAVSTTPLPVWTTPHILRLPTPVFRRLAASMLTIDATARTSMAYDLMARRKTEIDALQGRIVAMGAAAGVATPIAAAVLAAMRDAEAEEGPRRPRAPQDLRR